MLEQQKKKKKLFLKHATFSKDWQKSQVTTKKSGVLPLLGKRIHLLRFDILQSSIFLVMLVFCFGF